MVRTLNCPLTFKFNSSPSQDIQTCKNCDTKIAIKFRVDGEELTVDYDKMHPWLGFPRNGFASKPKGWNATSVWEMLTGQSSFTPRNAGNKWIKDESFLYLHKYLCYALFGRVEASKVQIRDLFVLESIESPPEETKYHQECNRECCVEDRDVSTAQHQPLPSPLDPDTADDTLVTPVDTTTHPADTPPGDMTLDRADDQPRRFNFGHF
ncbi:hypothetical protein JCGZ_03212 [Jatropha curcas]|uniref:Arabidopsis retrotransposon Orf1 C-terminal domain-containing protein n=1 Tax=Jatropha curcas TaxID=180498 RepID=A0A067JP20_JATCU|nr:hypothetical protein JCGZ_03212 [Jatropha curcas]